MVPRHILAVTRQLVLTCIKKKKKKRRREKERRKKEEKKKEEKKKKKKKEEASGQLYSSRAGQVCLQVNEKM